MKAVRLYEKNDIRIIDVPMPTINERELLIQVKRAGICGTDMRIIKNGFPGVTADNPRTLGHEFSGIIAEVGSAVEGYSEGMRVTVAPNMGCGICDACVQGDQHLCRDYTALGIQSDGGFAEYVRIPEQAIRFGNIVRIPDNVSDDAAALNEPLSCVYNGIKQCPVNPGDNVLIIGAGPIGLMYAMLAKMSGAGKVFINNRSPDRLRICKEVDSTFIPVGPEGIQERIYELSEGKGIDMCVTANPSPEAQQLAVELAAMKGRINFFGGLPKDRQMVNLNTNAIHYKQLMVTGTTKANNHHFHKTLQFIANGIIDVNPLISARYPIEQFNEALSYAGSSQGIKTLISFD
ncbi:Zn-dependent alcohol dehydrogenase [Paenibacillus sp. MY03]|uniref:alcohol dehydrogenase catalytic domain-containing protein n=1 Tax=Paenibacillus sp. MY03 TaxID=302980 RepID=UPI000B3D3A92|nr:alcohol dehydrogenase catalytic domain-containing protein [Paenibacillus sp. MY03]OUS75523.1 Zn-dependent alcohol dehydrogenase [Paenibacillus sp. MY03]